VTETPEQMKERRARALCIDDDLYPDELFEGHPLWAQYEDVVQVITRSDNEAGYVTVHRDAMAEQINRLIAIAVESRDAEIANLRERNDALSLQADEWEGKYTIVSELIAELQARDGMSPTTSEQLRERLLEAIGSELVGVYDCTRVWEAWSVGTMSQNDFVPSDERLDEIVDTVMAVMPTQDAEITTLRARIAELEEQQSYLIDGVAQRSAERELLCGDKDVNNIVQTRIETGVWWINPRGFLIRAGGART